MEITLPNSQGNQNFRSVAGKRSNGRAVYLGDPRLALLGRSPVGAEKSALTTPCPVAAGSVFSGKVQESDQLKARGLVSQIRQVVNVKDSFTRMNLERERRGPPAGRPQKPK